MDAKHRKKRTVVTRENEKEKTYNKIGILFQTGKTLNEMNKY